MFNFEFRKETHIIGKFVSEEQYEAMEIDLVDIAGAVIGIQIVVMHFAISTDGSGGLLHLRHRERVEVITSRFDFLVASSELRIGGRELPFELIYLDLLLLDDRPDLFDIRCFGAGR